MNKKQQLFKEYARDLKNVSEGLQLKLIDVDANKKYPLPYPRYICPLCNKVFLEEDIDKKLTLEHVPPGTLGGQTRLLVCKDCNNTQGSVFEKHLIDKIRNDASNTLDIELQLKNGTSPYIKCKVRIERENNEVTFLVDKKNKAALYFNQQEANAINDNEEIAFNIEYQYPWRKVDLALLRIAYLRMFEVGGYGYYFSYSAQIIRQQLADSNNDLLPVLRLDQSSGVPEGVYREKSKYYSGFLVAIMFRLPNYEKLYFVLLPGLDEEHIELYKSLKGKKELNFTLTKIPES